MVFITLPECPCCTYPSTPCCTYPSTGDHQVGEGGGAFNVCRLLLAQIQEYLQSRRPCKH